MEYHLAIALHTEPLEWILKVPDHWTIFLYAKDRDYLSGRTYMGWKHHSQLRREIMKRCRVTYLPNVGRESHTFFYHIATNYNHLGDITVFTQGRYSDHCPYLLELLQNKTLNDIASFHLSNRPYTVPVVHPDKGFVSIGGYYTSNWRCDNKPFAPTIKRSLIKFWKESFGDVQYPNNLRVCCGNIVAVADWRLKRYSCQYYNKIIDLHHKSQYFGLPWAIENCWTETMLGNENDYVNFDRACRLYL